LGGSWNIEGLAGRGYEENRGPDGRRFSWWRPRGRHAALSHTRVSLRCMEELLAEMETDEKTKRVGAMYHLNFGKVESMI
jgi:hypothetical protein